MNKEIEIIKKYCTGCGLCNSVLGVELQEDGKGFFHPNIDENNYHDNIEFFKSVCPSQGKASSMSDGTIWGAAQNVWISWSSNKDVRFRASSGGTLSSLCCYLLEAGIVDGIIQTTIDDNNPIKTQTVISTSKDEIINCCGSRYSISHPLKDLISIIDENKKYAFVGKPCDVSALRGYLQIKEELKNNIIVLLSFFCAGMPSIQANIQLLSRLGCSELDNCQSVSYRGNGWPGHATVIMKDGSQNSISYQESWRNILGRDVATVCRFCFDGIGECADISCGDAWYISKDGKPIVDENDGRNVLFARTSIGNEICLNAFKEKQIELFEYNKYEEELKKSQGYQFDRRATMNNMICGMKFLSKKVPLYDKKVLKEMGKNVSFKTKAKRFLGIIKRGMQGKIKDV